MCVLVCIGVIVLHSTIREMNMWTRFWDMSSGGGRKEPPYHYIYIELPEKEAVNVFYHRFHHNPRDTACSCCGENYSITEYETLDEATEFHRPKKRRHGQTVVESVEEHGKREDVLYIIRKEINVQEEAQYDPGPGYYPDDDYSGQYDY